ncbi:MAG: AhpC/TSA family protein [Pyrinomonadaceae bacterium]|nr:AhpC/TSA family protein [Pyrinomonadaceae bacterium]
MRKLILFIVIISVVFSIGCTTQEEPSAFTISGQIKNARTGKIILTREEDINRKKVKFIEEIKPDKDGRFKLDLNLEPHIYTLNFYNEKKLMLAIDKGQNIEIEADGDDLNNIKVSGSVDTEKLKAYEKYRKESLSRLVISVRDKLKATDDYNSTDSETAGLAEIENYEKHKTELNDFITEKMGDSIAIYPTTLRWDGEKNFSLFEAWANNFEKKHGNIEITKRIKEKVALLKATGIGGKAAEIEMPDKDGRLFKLEPSEAEYTLIDFWASWCGPCRRESKTIGALYEKYKSRGFEIYGVSLDDDKEKWLAALEIDKRIWTNVSTLKGFNTPAAHDYGVTALPAKFLIDSNGKIIAKNLSGKELKEKIDDLFK